MNVCMKCANDTQAIPIKIKPVVPFYLIQS